MLYIQRQHRQRLTQQQRNNRRKRASPHQLAFLRKKFMEDPRPDQLAREIIGRQIDMTPRSVQIWFQNNRAKARVQERKHAQLYQLPLTTTSCGDNISRVHFDMEALSRRQRSQLYLMDEFSGSAPNLPTAYSRSLIELSDPTIYSGFASSPKSVATQPSSPNLESVMSSPDPHFGSEIADEERTLFSALDFLDNTKHDDTPYNNEELESVDGLAGEDDDFDIFLSRELRIQGIRIGDWNHFEEFSDSMRLSYVPCQKSLRVFIEESQDGNTGQEQTGGRIVIEFDVFHVSQPSDQMLVLNTETYPQFFHVDAWGNTEPYELDPSDGNRFGNEEVILTGDFSAIDNELFYLNSRGSQVMDPFKLEIGLAPEN